MPAAKLNNGTKSGPKRLELPALNFNFGKITDGTNIPPPPDSPVEKKTETLGSEKPSLLPSKDQQKTEATTKAGANGNLAGRKRPADGDVPPSPTTSARPGSLRRLFSRTLLNNSYAEGEAGANSNTTSNGNIAASASVNGSRPASRSGGSFMDDRKSKRGSGFFSRLRSSGSRRSSLAFEQQHSTTNASANNTNKPSGPPPPMIPELKDLEKDEGSLGNDLFKNIK